MNQLNDNEKLKLLDDLFDQFLNSRYLTEEEEKSGDWNTSIDDIVSKNLMLLKRLKTQTKAELVRKRYERVKQFIENFRLGLKDNIDEYRSFAEKIFANPKYSELQPMFNNLEKVTEKDEQSMLLDAKILELFDEMEQDFDDTIDDGKD